MVHVNFKLGCQIKMLTDGICQDFEYYMDKLMYQKYLHLIANFCVTVSNRAIFN